MAAERGLVWLWPKRLGARIEEVNGSDSGVVYCSGDFGFCRLESRDMADRGNRGQQPRPSRAPPNATRSSQIGLGAAIQSRFAGFLIKPVSDSYPPDGHAHLFTDMG